MFITNFIFRGITVNVRNYVTFNNSTQRLTVENIPRLKKKANFTNSNSKSKRNLLDYCDSLKLRVIGGSGGNGCPVSKAIGGSGGNVVVAASDEIEDLSYTKSNFPDLKAVAAHGLDGRKSRLVGPDGCDCLIKVPCGITLFNEFMSPIGNLVKNGDSTIVAYGGQGGSARNNFFGTKGQSQWVTLDLRYYVDIGLVGYPDSGKSLLLTKLSTSNQSLIGSPEKTYKSKRPWVGDIKFKDGRLISCVDLPSLIEGAHVKDGLGHHHLKHLYHNQLILFVIDIHGFNRGVFRKPTETLLLLNKQIEIYDDRFLSKPALIVVNKMDLPGADVAFEEFIANLKKIYSQPDQCDLDKSILPRRLIKYQDIIPISCFEDRNIDYVKQRVRELIDFNYMSKRDPDCPRTFISLLDRVMKSRKQTKIKLL